MSRPYSFINERTQTWFAVKASLSLGRRAADKFDVLNAHIRNGVVVAGEVVIVGDDSTHSCTTEEAALMKLASAAHQDLAINNAGDDFIIANHELITRMLGHASIGMGVAVDAWRLNLKEIKETLDSIDALHKEHMASGTLIERNVFYTKRRQLFDRLDKLLKGFLSLGAGLRITGSIRKMLGISTKSYLHTGEIKNYAEKVGGVARAANFIKKGVYVGIALDTVSTAVEISAACSNGREDECTKAKYVEGGTLAGGLLGAAGASAISTYAAPALCLALLGATTGPGALACLVIAGGAMGLGGGMVGEAGGEEAGRVLYRVMEQ